MVRGLVRVFRVFGGEEKDFYHERHEIHEKKICSGFSFGALVRGFVRVFGVFRGEEKARAD